MQRPSDDSLRKARTTLRSLVSDGPSRLPSLNLVADSIRVELESRGTIAILYVSLDRYGRLEPIFGWHIVAAILDAVAANLENMVGSTLRRLDVVQLLVRFSDRVGAQLIATGVRTRDQARTLARNGVELFCGELYARADTRLPMASFSG